MIIEKGEEVRGDDGVLWGHVAKTVDLDRYGIVQADWFVRADGTYPDDATYVEAEILQWLKRKKEKAA